MDSQVSIPKIPGCLTSENKETGSPNYVITFWLFLYCSKCVLCYGNLCLIHPDFD